MNARTAAATPKLGRADALIVVDVQNDFCPGGALSVAEGDQVVPVLNEWIAASKRGGAKIVASRDWHPPDHVSFHERGGPWPVHCVQNTPGAALNADLKLPRGATIVSKGIQRERDEYSALGSGRLARELKQAGVQRLWIGGLALDVCVRATVLDALRAGFEVHLIKDATRAVNVRRGDDRRTLRELEQAGCVIEENADHAHLQRPKPGQRRPVHRSVRADDGAGVRRREARSAGRVRAGVSHAAAQSRLRRRRRTG